MSIVFQNFRHLFLELFCAEAALNVRYSKSLPHRQGYFTSRPSSHKFHFSPSPLTRFGTNLVRRNTLIEFKGQLIDNMIFPGPHIS